MTIRDGRGVTDSLSALGVMGSSFSNEATRVAIIGRCFCGAPPTPPASSHATVCAPIRCPPRACWASARAIGFISEDLQRPRTHSSDNPYRRSYSSWCPTNSGTPRSNLPGAFPVVSVGVNRPEAIEPTQRLCRLPERQGFRKLAGRIATRLNPERPKAIAAPFAPADHRISRDHALPCIQLEYLVDRFLFSSGEPVVCARSAWLIG